MPKGMIKTKHWGMDANHQYDLRLFSQHTADMVNIKPNNLLWDEQFSIYIDISDLQVVRSFD